MKTVDKAMQVLDQFSLEQTEFGLSELARSADLDKAATRRLLVALGNHGFIEQVSETRKYRLGQGFLRLARIREASVPLTQAAQEVVLWLRNETDETAHISVPISSSMSTIAHQLPMRGNIVNIDPAEALPFHATSAGIAYLSALTPDSLKRVLAHKRRKYTSRTPTARAELLAILEETSARGYAHCRSTFDEGVASLAMAFFLDMQDPAGTVSIALPEHKLSEARCQELLPVLSEAVRRIEVALTGLSQRQPLD